MSRVHAAWSAREIPETLVRDMRSGHGDDVAVVVPTAVCAREWAATDPSHLTGHCESSPDSPGTDDD